MESILFSGGGMLGIAYVGLFKELRKKYGESIRDVCGVSVGAAFAIFWCLGYSYEELKKEILQKDFRFLADPKLNNFFSEWGLDTGKNIREWIESFIIRKGINPRVTFSEFAGNLHIIATNLSKLELTLFNKDTTPDVLIVDAVMMSMSIPFIFTAKKFQGDVYVDGALLSNLPIEVFMTKCGIKEENLMAFKLVDRSRHEITDIKTFVMAIGQCISKVICNETCKNLIEIDVSGFSYLDFKMTKETKKELIKRGKITLI